jgi:methionyl-tRNA formyltransferase
MTALRLVFMGTPDFSVPCLNALINAPHIEIVAVVTQPDRPAGRGKKLTPSPVKVVAESHGIPVLTPERLRREDDIMAQLEAFTPDYIITIAFGQILPPRVLETPKKGVVNVHASLLPEYRGANPIQWAVLDGKTETGLTTMFSDEGVDTGDMLLKRSLPIEADDTTGSLSDKLAQIAGDVLLETLAGLENGSLTPEKQNDALATFAPKLKKDDASIDWTASATVIKQRIQALTPFPSAKVTFEEVVLKLGKVSVVEGVEPSEAQAGQVLEVNKQGIWVQTGGGILCIESLQPAGKGLMKASDWGRNALATKLSENKMVSFQ